MYALRDALIVTTIALFALKGSSHDGHTITESMSTGGGLLPSAHPSLACTHSGAAV